MPDLEAFGGIDGELRLDSSSTGPAYLLVGRNGTHIKLSASAFHLLQAARSGLSWDAVAETMSRQNGHPVSVADLEASYDRVAKRLAEIDGQSAKKTLPPGFWLRWQVLSRAATGRIATRLAGLFAPGPAPLLIGLIFAIVAGALWQRPSPNFSSTSFWPAYGLFLLSMIAHELGHVSACRRYGARPNDIGFTIYWIFPAFYSDVTTAWQLRRWHRVVVDLGGVFFQLIVGSAYWLAFLASGWQAFETAFVLILYACLFSLNPVFKFDGYWVLADALGVTDLSQQPKRIARYVKDKFRGLAPAPLPWPRWVKILLFVYSPLSIAFWIAFTLRLVPEIFHRAVAYPGQVTSLVLSLLSFRAPEWSDVHALLVSTFLLTIAVLMARHLLERFARYVTNRSS